MLAIMLLRWQGLGLDDLLEPARGKGFRILHLVAGHSSTVSAYLKGLQALAEAGLVAPDQLLSLIIGRNNFGIIGFSECLQQGDLLTATTYINGLQKISHLLSDNHRKELLEALRQCQGGRYWWSLGIKLNFDHYKKLKKIRGFYQPYKSLKTALKN
jgi:hypothetical protein